MQSNEHDYLSVLPATKRMFSSPRIDRELVTDFFMTFARAEYALKQAAYVRPGRYEEPIIEWEDFARTVGGALLATDNPELLKAIDHLSQNPPQKQMLRNGSLTWKPRKSDNTRDPVFLIKSITTVRNNLFHGGKEFDATRGVLAERDSLLIRSSLLLLVHAVSLEQTVLHAFGELPPEHYAA